jgi:ubiquinone/menaquinone biosynthesis C-methylase UbiE
MSSKSFTNYAQIAETKNIGHTEVAGRYAFQAAAERRIILDVADKLKLESNDSLLEIGCGPGNLLLPLSFIVEKSYGIDNAAALKRMKNRAGNTDMITALPGDFLQMELPDVRYTKILIYSVLHYLSTIDEAERFISRALGLLSPGGRLLIGDLPNSDKRARWSNSESGKEQTATWYAQVSNAGQHPLSFQPPDERLININDETVFSIMKKGRALGYESYLLPQKSNLPFGNTREDILFVAGR